MDKPIVEPDTTIIASAEVFGSEANLDHARGLLAQHGYATAIIPEPLAENIQADRIYFLVPVRDKLRARTAFIQVFSEDETIEIEVYRGWHVEHPREKSAR